MCSHSLRSACARNQELGIPYLSAAEIFVHASAETGHKLSFARRALHLHDVRSTSRPRQQPGGKSNHFPIQATKRIFPSPAPLGSKWSVQRPDSTLPTLLMESHVRTKKRWTRFESQQKSRAIHTCSHTNIDRFSSVWPSVGRSPP